jgi:DNA-binding response OmpR family regulator
MKKHILLIDDDNDELEIFCNALNHAAIDYKCTWVQDVTHATRIMEYLIPDAIFIDFNMPAMNGIEGIELIKHVYPDMQTPVVLYSNFINEDNRRKAGELGAQCIQKPFTLIALSKALQNFFTNNQLIIQKHTTDMENRQPQKKDYPDEQIENMPFSNYFKQTAAENGFTTLRQFLDLPVTRLLETPWITVDMIEELASVTGQKQHSDKNTH